MNKINLLEECRGASVIGISGHIRPDGDCVGSCMALWLYLKKAYQDAEVCVFLEQPPEIFKCICGAAEINSEFPERPPFDVFIALDTVKDRLGGAEKYFDAAKKTINIDHHISNESGCGMINYVDPAASSTAQLVYEMMEPEFLDAEIAQAVYIGIIHDCGVFRYSNTSPRTLRIAADLIEYGFDFPRIIDETFYEKTYIQNQIMGRALLESIIFMDGKCIVSGIDRKTMQFYGAGPKDLDGIVNQLRITKGVECAIFMYETGTLEFKVSLRSNRYIDVSQIASFFGGGGHVRAAGCTMTGTFYDVINNLSERIALQIEKQDCAAD